MDLLIIGFDGADHDLINRFVDEGELPNIEKIRENGSHGMLESTAIPITPSAWTTFMTGKNPGKHGIFDFTRVNPKGLEVVSFNDVDEKTIFEILSEDKKVGTLNIPATYPPKNVNGFMVSGMMTPNLEKSTDHDEVLEILRKNDYTIEVPGSYNPKKERKLLDDCFETLGKRHRTALDLIEKQNPDVFMPVFTVGDRVSHWFWKYHDENHPEFQESEFNDAVREVYRRIDTAVGELLESSGGLEETNVVIMSDHGFTGLYHGLNLNRKLMDEGLLELKNSPISRFRKIAYDAGMTMENAYQLVKKLGMEEKVKSAADNPDSNRKREIMSMPFLSFGDVDFENTHAYSALHFGPVFLNTEEHRENVIEILEELEHEGEKIVENIEHGEDLYHGPYADQAPDIVYHTKGMHYQGSRYFEFGSNKVITKPFNNESGHHRLEGIFAMAGPDFEQNGEIKGAHIMDIAPTVLKALGKEIPGDMDGQPLKVSSRKTKYDEAAISDF